MTGGAAAGIAVGTFVGFVIAVIFGIWLIKKYKGGSSTALTYPVESTNHFNVSSQNLDATPSNNFQNIYGPAYNTANYGQPTYA